jgi:hypothetical protein
MARAEQIQCGISAQPFQQIWKLGDIHRNLQLDRRAPAQGPLIGLLVAP